MEFPFHQMGASISNNGASPSQEWSAIARVGMSLTRLGVSPFSPSGPSIPSYGSNSSWLWVPSPLLVNIPPGQWKSPHLGRVSSSPKNGSSPLPEWESPLLSAVLSHATMVVFPSPLGLLPFLATGASYLENGAIPTAEWEFPFT